MIIKRIEPWGIIEYDTCSHEFEFKHSLPSTPYSIKPIVLNIDLTFKCNMKCTYCVAKDMQILFNDDCDVNFQFTKELMKDINNSDFMVIVITGGEPLLPELNDLLLNVVSNVKNKGIIIDTNGTIFPSKKVLKKIHQKNIMIRVSWDSLNPNLECKTRKYPKSLFTSNEEYLRKKEELIRNLKRNGIETSIQTVISRATLNDSNFIKFFPKFKSLGVQKWFLQRFIPSYKEKENYKLIIDNGSYEAFICNVNKSSSKYNIDIFSKNDRRHNSVFLLVRDGMLYTQSDDNAGEKIYIGNIGKIKNFFEMVSSSDHKDRYINEKR